MTLTQYQQCLNTYIKELQDFQREALADGEREEASRYVAKIEAFTDALMLSQRIEKV